MRRLGDKASLEVFSFVVLPVILTWQAVTTIFAIPGVLSTSRLS